VTIVTSRVGKEVRILGVLEDRKKATVFEFLDSIPKKLKKTVISVCSDFYEGFINAAKEAFGKQIRIVIDRFHIAKLYRKSVETIRKQEMKRLKNSLSEEEYGKLNGVIWALRKSELSDNEKALLKRVFKHSPKLKEAYQLSNELTKIFNTNTTRNGGIRRLTNWISKVNDSGITAFKTFVGTLSKWMKEIANYFVLGENSGFVEGFNNRIKVLKRRCYGIIDRLHLFQRISLDIGGSQVLPVFICS
jgi:transposase